VSCLYSSVFTVNKELLSPTACVRLLLSSQRLCIVTVVRGLSLLLSSQRHRPTRHHSGRRAALERLANRGPLLVVVSGAPFYAAAYVHVQAAAHNARLETEVPSPI
jgi:hypothetical protein